MDKSFPAIFMMYFCLISLMWVIRGTFFEFPTHAALVKGLKWPLLIALLLSCDCYFNRHCPPLPHFLFEEPPAKIGGDDYVPLLQRLREEREKNEVK